MKWATDEQNLQLEIQYAQNQCGLIRIDLVQAAKADGQSRGSRHGCLEGKVSLGMLV
jgi:hypothetical protein